MSDDLRRYGALQALADGTSEEWKDPETQEYPAIRLGEGSYSSDLLVWTRGRICQLCGVKALCLHADSSSDEYGPVILCMSCIKRIMGDQ